MSTTDLLLVTRDPDLLASIARVAAAAGIEHQVADAERARPGWLTARSVIVGDDCAAVVHAELGSLTRSRVRVATVRGTTADDPAVWRAALDLRAEQVAFLPADERALVGWLTDDGGDGQVLGSVLGFVGSTGGLGTSTLAAVAALVAAGEDSVVLVDADPAAGGLDLLLGCEDRPGIRWPDLRIAGADLSATSLVAALPTVGRLGVLTSARSTFDDPPPGDDLISRTLALARQRAALVIVDLPRASPEALPQAVGVIDALAVLTSTQVAGVIAARRVIARLHALGTVPGLVISDVARGRKRDRLDLNDVSDAVGAAAWGRLVGRTSIAANVDAGLGPTIGRRERRSAGALIDAMIASIEGRR